jgi:hypothetical protein
VNWPRGSPWWADLSDDELGARLLQRGDPPEAVDTMVSLRDDADMQVAIAAVLGWHEET